MGKSKMLISKNPYLWGGGLGLLSIPLHLLLSKEQSLTLAAVYMGVIAGVYIGFAAKQDRFDFFAFEFFFAIVFASVAFVGAVYVPLLIPLTYLLHGCWDLLHHRGKLSDYTPGWYVPFCVIFDWILGVFFLVYWFWLV